MVYVFLKYLLRLTLSSYFKIIKVSGKENIPKEGPIIFVANHPSTLMDPIVIGAIVKPQIYFLAAAEFMGKGILPKIMGSLFNMIPVYRPDTLPNKAAKNSDVFEKCYSHLGDNGSILIFPEGSSVTEKRLRPLKTGTARIAYGTENSTGVKVQIIPIGLNYSDPHSFQSELYVSIGKPIITSSVELNAIQDDFEKAKVLTEIISDKLKENLIHLEDERIDSIFEKIRVVSNHELQSFEGEKPDLEAKFKLSQEISEGLSYYGQKHPEVIEIISRKLDNYIKRASFYGVSDASISRGATVKWEEYVRIILGIPVFVFGYITNSLPYFASIWTFRKFKIDTSFQGSIGISLGLIYYLIWYIGWGIFLSQITHLWWFGIIFLAFVYAAGLYTIRYLTLIKNMQQQGKLKRLLKRNRNVYESLQDERTELMKEIVMYSEIIEK